MDLQEKLNKIARQRDNLVENGNWEESFEKPFSQINIDKSYDKFIDILDKELSKKEQTRILDINCGGAEIWTTLLEHVNNQFSLYGIDLSPQMIELATDKYMLAKSQNFCVGDPAKLEFFEDIKFSSIVSRGGLINLVGKNHFKNIINSAYDYLCDNGLLLFDYPSKFWFDTDPYEKKDCPLNTYTPQDIMIMINDTEFQQSSYIPKIKNLSGKDPVLIVYK